MPVCGTGEPGVSPRSRRCSSASPLTLSRRHRPRPATTRLRCSVRAGLSSTPTISSGAKARAEAALARDPESGEAHYLLGQVAERRNDLASAVVGVHERRRSTRRGWPRLTIGSGSCSASRGARRKRSPSSNARSSSTRRSSTRSITSARRAGGRVTSPARSRRSQAAVKLRPDHAEARYYLGLTLEALGQLAPAIAELRDRGPPEPVAGRGADAAGRGAAGLRRSRRRHRASRDRGSSRSVGGRRAEQPGAGAVAEGSRRRCGRGPPAAGRGAARLHAGAAQSRAPR